MSVTGAACLAPESRRILNAVRTGTCASSPGAGGGHSPWRGAAIVASVPARASRARKSRRRSCCRADRRRLGRGSALAATVRSTSIRIPGPCACEGSKRAQLLFRMLERMAPMARRVRRQSRGAASPASPAPATSPSFLLALTGPYLWWPAFPGPGRACARYRLVFDRRATVVPANLFTTGNNVIGLWCAAGAHRVDDQPAW